MPTHFHKRVKCANCGMIYNMDIPDMLGEDYASHICPGCGSNAYDEIQKAEWRNYKS